MKYRDCYLIGNHHSFKAKTGETGHNLGMGHEYGEMESRRKLFFGCVDYKDENN